MIMDDDLAGKGTRTARNASTVDGWNCVGNPGGIYSETGVLSWCENPPIASNYTSDHGPIMKRPGKAIFPALMLGGMMVAAAPQAQAAAARWRRVKCTS
jgi:hypothetical protein